MSSGTGTRMFLWDRIEITAVVAFFGLLIADSACWYFAPEIASAYTFHIQSALFDIARWLGLDVIPPAAPKNPLGP